MNKVTLFKRGTTWWIYYRNNGTRIRKSLQTTNATIAKRKAQIYENKILTHETEGFRGRIQLDKFWNEYLPYAKTNKRIRTIDTYLRIWKNFSAWLECQCIKFVDQITKGRFQSYRLYLLNKGLQKSTVNIVHRTISAVLSFAVEEGYLEWHCPINS